ncbi:hypothetical protein CDCA_CDCA01G0448 [Cyanidium caldarium]|uniref:CRAL-TRIO domain-containing protein n=1 Tax=Cyanidium caldarium TaxID=2771 RepID=A0AAV9IR79_CYACA|nr:hypothetical protein CDCA_CDCA01G0448 [Cyanidium caldarium]
MTENGKPDAAAPSLPAPSFHTDASASDRAAEEDDDAASFASSDLEAVVMTPAVDENTRALVDSLRERIRASGIQLSASERRWSDDACLSRFLRARRRHVGRAYRQWQETLLWRREFGVEEMMLRADLADVRHQSETGKMYVHGYDKYNRPLVIMTPRLQNTSERKTSQGQMRHLVYTLERAVAMMRPPVEKLCLIIDFQGYSLRNAPSLQVQRQTLKILQDHYPERLGMAICIDAPVLFWTFFQLIKPFIDKRTAAKIKFAERKAKPGTRTHMGTLLQAYVDGHVLPAGLGGKSSWRYSNQEYFARRIIPSYLCECLPADDGAAEDVDGSTDTFWDAECRA